MSGIERLYAPPEIGAPGQRRGRERRRDLRLAGLFVLAMAGVAVGALALLRPGLFGGTYLVTAYFADATGLAAGMPVLQSGYAIGLVDTVAPRFPGRDADAVHCPGPAADRPGAVEHPCFRARLRIAGDWPIPVDSRALVGSAGLLQGAAIKIEPGRAGERLADGGRLRDTGRETDLMAQLATLTDSLQALVSETIAPTLASIQQQVRAIEALIGAGDAPGGEDGEGDGEERLAGALASVQRLAAGIESVVDPAQLGRILAAIEEVSVNLREASAGLSSGTAELRVAVRRYGELAGDMRQVVERSEPDVSRSLDDAQYLLQELAATLPPILANIEEATRNLAALSHDLRANPAVILRGRETEDPSPWPR
jgi:phospholipid/cholesterol/gamma-HCH transport system substrate-binding protein